MCCSLRLSVSVFSLLDVGILRVANCAILYTPYRLFAYITANVFTES